jgi:hypothetical protein
MELRSKASDCSVIRGSKAATKMFLEGGFTPRPVEPLSDTHTLLFYTICRDFVILVGLVWWWLS